jgi:hypothetical protein
LSFEEGGQLVGWRPVLAAGLRVAEERAAQLPVMRWREAASSWVASSGSRPVRWPVALARSHAWTSASVVRTQMNVLPGTEPQRLSDHEVTVPMVMVRSADLPVLLSGSYYWLTGPGSPEAPSPAGGDLVTQFPGMLAAMQLSG